MSKAVSMMPLSSNTGSVSLFPLRTFFALGGHLK